MLTLYDYVRSSAAFRVRIALSIKALNFDAIPVHLLNNGGEQLSAAYRNINSLSLVPTLDIDGRLLTQSLAMIEYLEEVYPAATIMPKDAFTKAAARAFALTISADIHPLNNFRVLRYLQNEYHLSEEQKLKWSQHWLQLGLDALEKMLAKQSTRFCYADYPTIADICLIPLLYNARRFSQDVSHYPKLLAVEKECLQNEAFVLVAPKETVT